MDRNDILDILKQQVKPAIDGKVLYSGEGKKCAFNEAYTGSKALLTGLNIRDIIDFIENCSFEDIRFLSAGIDLNINIAPGGLEDRSILGAGMSRLLQKGILKDDIVNQVRTLTSSACDARMAGITMPCMNSAVSGNYGITAIIPPTVICRYLGYNDEKLARALALSHLTAFYVKGHTEKLSLACGCSVAVGIGAAASITWLLGGSYRQIVGAINNMVGALSGMVCDGAKGGCVHKLSSTASEAVIQAYLAVKDIVIYESGGMIEDDAEDTIKDLGILSS